MFKLSVQQGNRASRHINTTDLFAYDWNDTSHSVAKLNRGKSVLITNNRTVIKNPNNCKATWVFLLSEEGFVVADC